MQRISLLLQIACLPSAISVHLQFGQCPMKLPSYLSTKSPMQLSEKRRADLLTIGHRGASFSLPEHSLPAYRLALELGADYIETDLVGTKDGKLVAVHSIDLNITTNIDQVYPTRYRSIEKDGEQLTGFFVFDFTLEELKAIRVKQRLDGRSQQFNWLFGVPTLHDIIDLIYEWNNVILPHQNQTRTSGLYVELKSPEFHQHQQNISLADLFVEDMKSHPHADEMFFNTGNDTKFGCEKHGSYQVPPLVLECFDGTTLQGLKKRFVQNSMALPPFILLANKKDCREPMFWFDVGKMNLLSGIGPDKKCVLDQGGSEFMIKSKQLNLAVHTWTSREEVDYVSSAFDTAEAEMRYLYCKMGIAGMFTENVDLSVKVGVRGCDDYMTPEALLEEDISKLEEEDGGRVNGTISKEICSRQSGGSTTLRNFATIFSGFTIGILCTLIFSKKNLSKANDTIKQRSPNKNKTIQHGEMRGMRTLSTVDSDMEII